MAESSSRGPPPRKKPRSDVWEYFEVVQGENKGEMLAVQPAQRDCVPRRYYQPLRTSCFSDYKHDTAKQTTILEYSKHSEVHSKQITELITEMVVADMRPLRMVECEGFSLTTDIWTSIATEAYITMSGHFISPDWDMCFVVLTTSAFPERHTGVEISRKLEK